MKPSRTLALLALAVAAFGSVHETTGFSAAERQPESSASVVTHPDAYVYVDTWDVTTQQNENVNVGRAYNHHSIPLTFSAFVEEDPNNVVTRANVWPTTPIAPGDWAYVNLTASGAPQRDHLVKLRVEGENPGTLRAFVHGMETIVRIRPT